MTGHLCPDCGTPLGPLGADGRPVPGCGCAETAEAEFNPLRVRPYVTLPSAEEDDDEYEGGVGGRAGGGGFGEGPAGDVGTMPLPVVPPGAAGPAGPAAHGEPSALNPGRNQHDDLEPVNVTPAGHRGARRRRLPVLLGAAAALAVVGTAAYAGGLFSGDGERDKALVPDTESSAVSVSAAPDAPSPSQSPTASASPSASSSASASASASSSRTATAEQTSQAPDPSKPAGPATPPPTTATASGSVKTTPPASPESEGTLRRGDSGSEVLDLQERLVRAAAYKEDDGLDGKYDEDVENAVRAFQRARNIKGDPDGVYGPQTRRQLEAETGGS